MLAGAAFTEIHCIRIISVEVAVQGGGLGCLSCMLSFFVRVGADGDIPQANCALGTDPQVLNSLVSAINLWMVPPTPF